MKLPIPAGCLFPAGCGKVNNKLRPEKFLSSCFRTGVRFPPPPPRRRGLHIVRDDFFSKSHLSLISSLLLSKCDPLRWPRIWCLATDLEVVALILFTLDTLSRTAYRSRRLFFKKSSLTHSVAPPLQMRPAALGSHLVLGHGPGGSCIDTVHT